MRRQRYKKTSEIQKENQKVLLFYFRVQKSLDKVKSRKIVEITKRKKKSAIIWKTRKAKRLHPSHVIGGVIIELGIIISFAGIAYPNNFAFCAWNSSSVRMPSFFNLANFVSSSAMLGDLEATGCDTT